MQTDQNLIIVRFRTLLSHAVFPAVMLVALSACNNENENPSTTEQAQTVTAEADAEAAFEDIDDLTEVAVEQASATSGGRVMEGPDDDRLCEGVYSREGDRESGTITLDFGDGCPDKKGNIRKGKIVINYEGHRFEPGSVAVTTFEDFSVNDVEVEGIRTVTNISESIDAPPVFSITLAGGQLTWPDGTTASREAEKTVFIYREPNPVHDVLKVLGEASGINKRGIGYEMMITDTLVFKRECRALKRGRIPVSGVKVIETEHKTITVDYGDGNCDGDVEVIVNGESESVTVG